MRDILTRSLRPRRTTRRPTAVRYSHLGESNSPESNKIKKLVPEENTGIEVAVKNPQLRGGNIGGYYVYDVEGTDKNGPFSAKRRFNDFYELRSKLVENWPGIFIPPLPEKKTVGNKGADFVTDRSYWLDHFMKRCAKLSYVFYSEEMEIFLKTPAESVSKLLSGIKKEAPFKMLVKYKNHFSNHCQEETLNEKIQSSVDHYFKNLSQTIKFFQDFRTIAKELNEKKILNAKAYALFIKNTVSDYKRKLKPDEQEVVVQKYNNFVSFLLTSDQDQR
jgi:sorting nexin-1/2